MSSAIPGAVQALISIAQGALPSDATVWFGVPLPVYEAPITLQILKVTGEQEVAQLGPNYRREETFEIHCCLTSFAGDNDFVSRMTEVYANFSLLTVAIATNYTLNNTVRFAEIRQFDYQPDADGKGMTLGQLDFAVACQVRIESLT